jgi:hypothetical protein
MQGWVSVTLDIDARATADERVKRLMDEAAGRIFISMPKVDHVELVDRTGAILGVQARRRIDPVAPVDVPEARASHREAVPSWMSPLAEGEPILGGETTRDVIAQRGTPIAEPPRRHLSLAERLDLPRMVTTLMNEPPDAVEVLRAIMVAAGHAPIVDGDVIRIGDRVVIVLDVSEASAQNLNHAYFRFRSSHAAQGFVVVAGVLDPADVRRRELLEPNLIHVGVALGSDPLRFARAPAMEVHAGRSRRAS